MTDETAEVEIESDDEVEPNDAEPAPADDGDDAPEPTRAEKRIGQLVGERNALREDRDYWRQQALAKQPPEPEPEPEPEVEAPKRPRLADFDNDVEAYADALADYTDASIEHRARLAEQSVAESIRTASESSAKDAEAETVAATFQEKATEFAKTNTDFMDIVTNPTLAITEEMTQIIVGLDNGPEVLYHLGKNPEKAMRIAQKQGAGQVGFALAEVAREVATRKPGSKTEPDDTDAPEPHSRIRAGRGGGNKDPSKLPMKDFAKQYYSDRRRPAGK